MQTTVRKVPERPGSVDLVLPATDRALLTAEVMALLAIVLGAPIVAALLGGALLAIAVIVAVIAGVVALAWRLGIEFESAWLRSCAGPVLGDGAAADNSMLVPAAPVAPAPTPRASEVAGLGGARTPAR